MAERDGDLNSDDAGLVPDEPVEPGEAIEAAERRGMSKGAAIVFGIVALLVLAAIVWWFLFGRAAPPAADNTAPVTTLPGISVGPTESLPVATATQVPTATATAPATPPATTPAPTSDADRGLALNRWNWLADQRVFSVGGFIEGPESGGTCTLTAASGGQTLVGSAPAEPDASTTVCVVNLQAPDAAPGVWELTMTYEGPGGSASSDTVVVTVS